MATRVIYLCYLLENMGFPKNPDTLVYEDNPACIKWGNYVIRGRECAKNIDLCKHKTIHNHQMSLIKINTGTSKQLEDIFTKALPLAQFLACIHRILKNSVAGGNISTTPAGPLKGGDHTACSARSNE